MAAIRFEHVDKIYPNGIPAVRDFDLDVRDGELVVLVGPSGCGKSTALRMVAGLERPTRGRILIGSEDMTEVPPQSRDLAMVFQTYALYPHMRVSENLAFGLRMHRVPRRVIADRVTSTAEALGIGALLDRKPGELSGGQQQRVALGRALVRDPQAFLFDEPLSNLDAKLRVEARAELAKIHKQRSATMLYVTHDQEEAMTLGDRIVVMRDGAIQQVASPIEVYRHPASVFVAGFIGSPTMNFVRCEVRTDGARTWLASQDDGVSLDCALSRRWSNQHISVGIRPEDVVLTNGHERDVVGRVELVEALGRELLLHVTLVGPRPDRIGLSVLVPSRTDLTLDREIGLQFPRERLHLFDEHGWRISP